MRRRCFLGLGVLVGALLIILFAGCGVDQPADLGCPGPPVAGQQRLILRADSLGAMAEGTPEAPGAKSQLIAEQAPGGVCYWAVGGTQINHHQAALGLVDPTDCAVMALGTNDNGNEVWAQVEADLDAAVAELSDAQEQVWLTINQTGADLIGPPYSQRVEWFNAKLVAMDADEVSYPNLTVYRWDIDSQGHPEWLNLPDRLHYNETGNLHYRRALVRAARLCPEPLPAPTTTTTTAPETTSTSMTETTSTTTTEAPEANIEFQEPPAAARVPAVL